MTRRALGDAATLLLTAALGMVVEIAAGRLLAPHVGMSLYTWTAVIAVVVGGFSVGHLWGGRLADRLPGRRSGHLAVAWMLGGCALACAVAVPLLHLVAPAMVAEETPPLLGILGLALTGFLAPSLLVGAVSPPVMAMAVREAPPERVGRLLGRLSALGAFGAIAGTLAAG
ncbi:MAG: fused MFS/spermidine synthase, partial [Roseomonas sp.]|nr:fused MFS/spermidine synthase [Roseomonas sp.]